MLPCQSYNLGLKPDQLQETKKTKKVITDSTNKAFLGHKETNLLDLLYLAVDSNESHHLPDSNKWSGLLPLINLVIDNGEI
jgi:hypothetical protein